MKKILLITLAVVLIIVGGIWFYLFIFGAPASSQEFFADLGFGSSIQPTQFDPNNFQNDVLVEDVTTGIDETKALNLLTIRPVAGAVVVGTSTDHQVVRYMERGTGQIREIDLASNNERLLSDIVVAQTTQATWSHDGTQVVVESGNTTNKQVQLLSWQKDTGVSDISEQGQFISTELAPDAYDFAFSDDTKNLYYLRTDAKGSFGYSYSLTTHKPTVIFSLPFIAPNVEWTDVPLIFNRPDEKQDGYAYRLVKGDLQSAGPGGESLVAKAFYNTGSVLSSVIEGSLRGIYSGNKKFDVAIPAIPEKCVSGSNESKKIFCAYPIEQTGNLPTDWYKGVTKLQDYLWTIDVDENSPNRGTASVISDFTSESGQIIDAVAMDIDETFTRLIFRDKYSHALWMYDTNISKN